MCIRDSLSASIWLIYDYLDHHGHLESGDPFSWLTFDVLTYDSEGWSIASSGFSGIGLGIYLDAVSIMLLFVATFLCFLICWFAIGYMTTDSINDNSNHRFFAEFVLFSMGMFGMVLADNFLWLFIFWEIMGLCSYLLIGFYYWKEGKCRLRCQEGFPYNSRRRCFPHDWITDALRHIWLSRLRCCL